MSVYSAAMLNRSSIAFALSGLLLSCGGRASSSNGPEHAAPIANVPSPSPWTDEAARGVNDPTLGALLLEHWEDAMRESPEWATGLGDHRYDDRLDDPSHEAIDRRRTARRVFRERAEAISPDGLSDSDTVTRALLIERLASREQTDVCESERWNFSARANPMTNYNRLPELNPTETLDEQRRLLARYRAVPEAVDAVITNLRSGATDGLVTNRTTAERTLEMFDAQLEQPDAEWALYQPALAEGMDPDVARGLRETVTDEIRPAYARYRTFLRDEIVPYARDDEHVGVGALPNGEACYASAVRLHTSRTQSAQELHDLGLQLVAAVNQEMRELGQTLFQTDELSEILSRLRTDEALYFTTPEEVEGAAIRALDAARERMGQYFDVLPQAPCVVVPVPDYEAPFTTVAYYRPPHADGSKPGEYFVNTLNPETRPRFQAEVLAYHESIPGHHMQIAIAQELETVPVFRRHSHITVYTEGWALYTERLADEMGLYGGDLDRMGMLSYDAWRASRLVVDTGLHALGWSRARAEAFMREHTALAETNIANEVDRYISWPGQALAYKLGQLEIRRMRSDAETALGEAFELRGFHDVVLGGGAVTMAILEVRVQAWVAERQP